MGKRLAVIGNIGIGKTTLAGELARAGGYACALEEHETRPFQRAFASDRARYAIANQVDYLLVRAEQEAALWREARTGILDGGLDLDFEVFTRFFHENGDLTLEGFQLCERFYRFYRRMVPFPDLYLYLHAPMPVIERRLSKRGPVLRIAQEKDLAALDALLTNWVQRLGSARVLVVDASLDSFCSFTQIQLLLEQIEARFYDGQEP